MAREMTNPEVAATFRLLADLLSILGESTYRVIAYRRAAESIEALSEPLTAIRLRGDLQEIPGVGKEIAQKIGELLDTRGREHSTRPWASIAWMLSGRPWNAATSRQQG
jgi:DNA polymerase/3'-5' exonuclease PolX